MIVKLWPWAIPLEGTEQNGFEAIEAHGNRADGQAVGNEGVTALLQNTLLSHFFCR